MIKAIARLPDGRMLLIVGLSYANLDEFRKRPLDSYIRIEGKEVGLGVDVMFFSGENEDDIARALDKLIDKETVWIDKRPKN